MASCPFPIAIISFNRPDLLSKVLISLRAQTISINEKQIYLFQDGAQSRFSRCSKDDLLQNECVKRFQEIFPNGQVLRSPVNLGVALNFDRAERLFFEEFEAECGLFFEDDLVLSPHYIEALLQLLSFALGEPLVGYVAAYGDHRVPLMQQRQFPAKIVRMGHKWGFALTRRQWLRQREFVQPYLSIVSEREYTLRDNNRIRRYFASFGFAVNGSSQDAAKDVAGLVLGTTNIMCFPCFAHYIGKEGMHFSPNSYLAAGFDKTELFNEPPPQFEFPSRTQLETVISSERERARHLLDDNSKTPTIADTIVQTSAIEFVERLYSSLLDRPADEAGLLTWTNAIRNGMLLSDVVSAFIRSSEYESKAVTRLTSARTMQNATKQE